MLLRGAAMANSGIGPRPPAGRPPDATDARGNRRGGMARQGQGQGHRRESMPGRVQGLNRASLIGAGVRHAAHRQIESLRWLLPPGTRSREPADIDALLGYRAMHGEEAAPPGHDQDHDPGHHNPRTHEMSLLPSRGVDAAAPPPSVPQRPAPGKTRFRRNRKYVASR